MGILKTVGIRKWTKKRKTTDSKLISPEGIKKKREEKEKKSSAVFEKQKKTPLDVQVVKPERDSDNSDDDATSSSEPEVTTSSKPEVTSSSESEDTTKPENAAIEEGGVCPRGKQWEAAEKFCRKLYDLSVHHLYKHEELCKLKKLADMTAESVKWCTMKCPGPLTIDDDFKTPWGPNDENRYSMYKFLWEVEALEKLLTTTCLTEADTKELNIISKAKEELNVALEADPVLEYYKPKAPLLEGGRAFTKEEIQRIKFCYRIRRWYNPRIAYDEMVKFFNNRTTASVKRKFQVLVNKAKL